MKAEWFRTSAVAFT